MSDVASLHSACCLSSLHLSSYPFMSKQKAKKKAEKFDYYLEATYNCPYNPFEKTLVRLYANMKDVAAMLFFFLFS